MARLKWLVLPRSRMTIKKGHCFCVKEQRKQTKDTLTTMVGRSLSTTGSAQLSINCDSLAQGAIDKAYGAIEMVSFVRITPAN